MPTRPIQTVSNARNTHTDRIAPSGHITLAPDVPICQGDFPLDWYQDEFKPYAEEYLALEDRTPETVLPWLDRYVKPAVSHFGPSLLLLAHFYMGGTIVKLVERYGGKVADSYQLALAARDNPGCTIIVQSAVHFMAEAVALLARDDQQVWITNPKAGCTLEMHAKEHMVAPVAQWLIDRFKGDMAIVAYMNTSGRIKALAGETGGAVCTSANAHKVIAPILAEHGRVLFVPDQHLGHNVAAQLGLAPEDVYVLPDDVRQPENLDDVLRDDFDRLDRARLILWPSSCSVHTLFTPEMVGYHQALDRRVLIHPESRRGAVQVADGSGSTRYLWDEVLKAPSGSSFAIGTEGHFVRNLAEQARAMGVEVHHLADVPGFASAGCGCAAMSRNDPPHLAGMLDLLRKGEAPDINRVIPGDVVDEASMARDRLNGDEQAILVRQAGLAMERMIELAEA